VKKSVRKWSLAGAAAFVLACAGCIGPHYHPHQLVLFGKQPPDLTGPRDPAIAQNLSREPWTKSLVGPETGVGVVLFKSMGIQGWRDFHMHAKATGWVIMHQISSSGFFTVDIRLHSLTVDNVPVPILDPPRYMRLEVFLGRVSVNPIMRSQTNELITAEGKLAWDCDGWFEIHPQQTGDVRFD
jgi:hypothetical protein